MADSTIEKFLIIIKERMESPVDSLTQLSKKHVVVTFPAAFKPRSRGYLAAL